MPVERFESLTLEEFDKRLEASNDRLQQELVEAQAHAKEWEALVIRKERFSRRLDQILSEIECEESEIAALKKRLRPARKHAQRRSASPVTQ